MRRIIDGKIYDTGKAEVIYTDENSGRSWYVTKKGAYFIAYPNGEIRTKTEDEVRDFLAIYDVDKYIELFGEMEEA